MNIKHTVASLLLAAAAAPTFAADAGTGAVDRLVACSEVKDTRARLACFDREIAPLAAERTANAAPPAARAPVPAPPPPVARTSPTPAPAPAAAPSLGKEQLKGEARPAAKEEEQVLHASITSIQKVNSGAWLVALDNGQAWRHEDETQGAYLKSGEAVTIRKGSLGSYRLSRDAGSDKNWIRVTRVR